MNATKLFGIFGVMLLCTLALVGVAAAIPVSITRVEIDDHTIQPNQINRLDVLRDNTVDIEVLLESLQNLKDVEVQVFVSGFEHNVDVPLSDRIGPFDMDAGVTYRKMLHITFPNLVKEDSYKVRIVVSDRDGQELVQNYNIKIDVPRHDLSIVDALFTPSKQVQSGQALLSTVRVKNFGEKTEHDVKVIVSIPKLSVSAASYIDEIKSERQQDTEELYLRLPKCAEPGVYDLNIGLKYNDGFNHEAVQGKVEVLENPACAAKEIVEVQTPPAQPEQTPAVPKTNKVRTALEIILLVLVALLVVIGLIIGFTKMGAQE
jgi:hypothetical protein